MVPRSANNTSIAYPLYGVDGFASGWFKFDDKYLRPEVLYGSWPPVTTVKLGGRTIQSDRAVPVKIKLLEPEEDQRFWCGKKQHCERVNLGEFHRDFGDVEVSFSFSSPQTHIFFSGYSVHFEAFENLAFSSYNATVRVRPEHVLGNESVVGNLSCDVLPARCNKTITRRSSREGGRTRFKVLMEGAERSPQRTMNENCSTRDMLVGSYLSNMRRGDDPVFRPVYSSQQKGYFPLYNCQVPVIREGLGGRETVDYQYTAQHFNDCEGDIKLHEEFNVGVGTTAKSSPVSVPPVFPPLRPYELPELVFSTSNSRTRKGHHVTEVLRLKKHRHHTPQLTDGSREGWTPTSRPSDSDSGSQDFDYQYLEMGLRNVEPDEPSAERPRKEFRIPRRKYDSREVPQLSSNPINNAGRFQSFNPKDPYGGFLIDPRRPNQCPPWLNNEQVDATKKLTKVCYSQPLQHQRPLPKQSFQSPPTSRISPIPRSQWSSARG